MVPAESRGIDRIWEKHLNNILPGLVLAVVLVASLWAMTRQWEKPLLDMHSFRQTQTAISTYYIAKDPGMFLNYITPVLGKPWQAPMEVPIYQCIVARWHNISGMSLDQSGKLISILFWMACIWPVWWLLGLLDFTSAQRSIAGVLIYSSPLYLYWGRTFMIETTGLFLSLVMVACVVAGYRVRDWRWLLAALAFGIIAALCKASTWAIAVGVAGLIVLFSEGLPKWRDWRWIAGSGIVSTLPFIPTKLWLDYGDSLKMLNPFVRELFVVSSPHHNSWNYGTLQQKLDPATWEHIWRHITDQLLVPFPVIGPFLMVFVLVGGAIASPKRIPLILIFLAGFASGPVIFTNLYFEHSYYWCANGIWLLLAVGTALAGIWEFRPGRFWSEWRDVGRVFRRGSGVPPVVSKREKRQGAASTVADVGAVWPQAIALVLALTIAVSGFVAWSQRFLPILQALPTRDQFDAAWRKPVQKIVPPGRTILIVGNDWNPNSLYYAERKGIAFPTASWIPFPGPQLDESLAKLDPAEALGAVVINERLISTDNQAGISAILEKLGMSREGTRTPFGILFPALDLKFGQLPTEGLKMENGQ
jgi:hypothetical protein